MFDLRIVLNSGAKFDVVSERSLRDIFDEDSFNGNSMLIFADAVLVRLSEVAAIISLEEQGE